MKIGQTIKWGKIGTLGLPALEHTVQVSEFRQEVKVYKVPKAVDSSRYWVAATPANAVEEAPPSRVRETDLLVRFTLSPDGEAQLSYVRPEVQAA